MGLFDMKSVEKLSKTLRPTSDEQDASAAVALILRLKNKELNVLLVKRVEKPSDPWSGQMAFPGGKRDAEDVDLRQTVVREALEETSINLSERARFLGVMTGLRSSPRPEMKILPFVVLLEYEPQIRLNEGELEGYVWVPLSRLVQCRGTVKFSFGEVPAFTVGNLDIWGFTYKVLENFIETLS